LIVEKIAERIDRAYREKKTFKVMILLPLLPGFEGDIREDNSSVMRIQLHWEYWTISRSRKSLYSRLKHIENVGAYLQFYSLRQHGMTQGRPIT
jgi:phospholipase D1/2